MLINMARKPKNVRQSPAKFPPVPAEAALSFLKDTKGIVSWSARDLAAALNINRQQAEEVGAVLEAQGYVKRNGEEWITTPAGTSVSGAKQPRFTPDSVNEALDALRSRIAAANKNPKAPFKITVAVAFGDFLMNDRARVQAADVGVRVVRREDKIEPKSFSEIREEQKFLRELRARSAMLNLKPYADWMGRRPHLALL
jgi:hypothetical protein